MNSLFQRRDDDEDTTFLETWLLFVLATDQRQTGAVYGGRASTCILNVHTEWARLLTMSVSAEAVEFVGRVMLTASSLEVYISFSMYFLIASL